MKLARTLPGPLCEISPFFDLIILEDVGALGALGFFEFVANQGRLKVQCFEGANFFFAAHSGEARMHEIGSG